MDLKAFRVHGLYCGEKEEGTYTTWVWAVDEAAASEMCIDEMDSASQYCCGTNQVLEVRLLANWIYDEKLGIKSAEDFIASGA